MLREIWEEVQGRPELMRIQISQSSGSTEHTQNSDSKICSCKGKFFQSHMLRSMLGTYVLCDSTVGVVSYVYVSSGRYAVFRQ